MTLPLDLTDRNDGAKDSTETKPIALPSLDRLPGPVALARERRRVDAGAGAGALPRLRTLSCDGDCGCGNESCDERALKNGG